MLLQLTRYRVRKYSCCGDLFLNGKYIANTIENSQTRLLPGVYNVKLLFQKKWGRKMPTLIPEGTPAPPERLPNACSKFPLIGYGNGVYNSKNSNILVGEALVPGVVKHSVMVFERLYERIEELLVLGHSVKLIIE